MRVIGDIPHPRCKITLFAWNGKYLLKFELGALEQTYKLSELDGYDEAAARRLPDDVAFVAAVLAQFQVMDDTLTAATERL